MEKKKKLYIAGKVTGRDFEAAEKQFWNKQIELSKNYRVVNPIKTVWLATMQDKSWEATMQFLIPHLVECDILYLMKGWQGSKGAELERDIMKSLGKEIIYE